MRNFNLIKMALTLVILLGLVASSASEVAHDTNSNHLKMEMEGTTSPTIVKGLLREGNVVPMIDLPTVEITASIPEQHLVSAEMIDGNLVPSIELDEVVIQPKPNVALASN